MHRKEAVGLQFGWEMRIANPKDWRALHHQPHLAHSLASLTNSECRVNTTAFRVQLELTKSCTLRR